jgi:hypothetical protein
LFTNRRRAGGKKNQASQKGPRGLKTKKKGREGRCKEKKKGKEQKQRAKQRKKKGGKNR